MRSRLVQLLLDRSRGGGDVPQLPFPVRATAWLMLALGSVYAVTLVPGVRAEPGYRPAIDWWLNMTVDALVIVVLALRTVLDRRDRAAWAFVTAGLVAAFAGSSAYFAYYQYLDPVPSPSWADAGWLLFYGLLAVGLVLRLRTRARSMPRSLSLDGLIAGLTAAALAETYSTERRFRSTAAASPC